MNADRFCDVTGRTDEKPALADVLCVVDFPPGQLELTRLVLVEVKTIGSQYCPVCGRVVCTRHAPLAALKLKERRARARARVRLMPIELGGFTQELRWGYLIAASLRELLAREVPMDP